ncbi:MAG TPA: TetR/AcrR family transcriptional regulator [Pseudonocardiaceae bacterium]|jgi:AcrR family transcriptional regulator|nr:TetR/AcrR family transcriptional regulator [Pseudonocardiaceae bacterium]
METRKRRAYAPRVPAEQRRAELLDAALHLVATQGQRAVTMEAVAERVGVTKPVVYGLFASRTELLTALLSREHEQGLGQLMAILPVQAAAEPTELVARVLVEFLRVVRAAPDRWHCIVMPMADMPPEFHDAREHARAVVLRRAEELAGPVLLAMHAPAGLAPDIVAHTVVALFEMAARLVLTDPEAFAPERFITAVTAAMGLVTRG